jgi:hypothetical protein
LVVINTLLTALPELSEPVAKHGNLIGLPQMPVVVHFHFTVHLFLPMGQALAAMLFTLPATK